MEGIGEILRDARERKNVTLDEIEESTKIKKRYLMAMEVEEWSQMPGKVYAKGFLRTYARYLGLDEHALGDLYEISAAAAEKNDAAHGAAQKKRKEKKKEKPKEVDLHNKPKKAMIYFLCVLSVAALAFSVWAYKTYYLDELEADRQPPPPIVQPQPDPVVVIPVVEPDPGPVVYTAFEMKIEAIENCWLRLRDQETLVYEGSMRTGDVQEFSDLREIEIRIGNAGGIIMTLNGVELPLSGTSGQVVTRLFSIVDGVMFDDETGEALS